jgi:hypothetical protein
MKQMLLATAILFCTLSVCAQGNNIYRMTRDKEVSTFEHKIMPTDTGYLITSGQTGEIRESKVNFAFDTAIFNYKDTLHGTDYTARRTGNKINITGRLKNRTINKQLTVNSNPWYQAIEHALQDFAALNKNKVTFWFISADDCELREMEATKQGVETITLHNRKVQALHVKVNLTGFASLFWSADYWFRQTDNRFVRYETVEGPGGVKIVIEIINE